MAEEPEVIEHELEETRHALAEKIEQISEKISGTVETVTEAVTNVTETVGNVTEAVEDTVQTVAQTVSGTVETVKETVEAVGEKASETVEAVKETFNLPEQIRRRPWLWFGSSVAVGFAAGKIFAPRAVHFTPQAESFVEGSGYRPSQQEPERTTGNGRRWTAEEETPSERPQAPSMVSGLLEQFGPELNQLRELALGTLFGVARDMIAQAVPSSLKDQVQGLVNDFTEKIGGKPIQGSVLSESHQDTSPESTATEGGQHEQPDSGEMDRPMGAGEKKGKAAVGKSHRR
jgi:ElaB/YqjD/DUF883 family membrane-anchored ribosome-binding protein